MVLRNVENTLLTELLSSVGPPRSPFLSFPHLRLGRSPSGSDDPHRGLPLRRLRDTSRTFGRLWDTAGSLCRGSVCLGIVEGWKGFRSLVHNCGKQCGQSSKPQVRHSDVETQGATGWLWRRSLAGVVLRPRSKGTVDKSVDVVEVSAWGVTSETVLRTSGVPGRELDGYIAHARCDSRWFAAGCGQRYIYE
jgi:hypothetical protein